MNDRPSADVVAGRHGEPRSVAPEGSRHTATVKEPPSSPSALRSFIEWVIVIAVALIIAVVVRTFVLAHFKVEGTSMLDTLHPGDRVLVNKMSYRVGEPGRGDVVVLHELGGERDLIKRVIGLPGESVRIEDCQVYIDDSPLTEDYLSDEVRASSEQCEAPTVDVGEGQIYVLGDNRPHSADSRAFGPVEMHEVVGRAFVVFFPFTDAQWL